jgi:small-conductance mechanosensitive channel
MIAQQATESVDEVVETAGERGSQLLENALANLPRVGLGVAVGLAVLLIGLAAAWVARRALARKRADAVVIGLLLRIIRIAVVFGAILIGLAVVGVPVGSALAGLAVVGVAVGLAVQGILENFIAGIILSFRRPFRAGDQIISSEFEGTVEDIDLRVTRIIDYDGEVILIPNRDVYTNPLVNLTRRGSRRTCVTIGVDYRDDHDEAREVIRRAVAGVEGVRASPAPEVLLTELGESSVNFEIRYWTLPHIGEVRGVQDRVLSAAKRGIEDAGMTIPWPIRTLVPDGTFRLDRQT